MEPAIVLAVLIFSIFILLSKKRKRQNPSPKETNDIPASKRAIDRLPTAKVEYVIDGDTVIVRTVKHTLKIRLDAIDCPENGQQWGDMATYGLIKLVGGKMVKLEIHGKDIYQRTLATLYVWNPSKSEWINVNEKLVLSGHAWVMRQFYHHLPKERQWRLNRMQQWARSKKMGLWQSDDPIPPWIWRRRECIGVA